MARTCETCGKQPVFGNQYARRGLAKYKGGVGIKTTGVSRRKFLPNLQHVRIEDRDGTVGRGWVCTKCLKSGKVKKPVKREIPEGVRQRMLANQEAKSPEARRRRAAKRAEARRARIAAAKSKAASKGAAKAPPPAAKPTTPPKGKGK